MPIEKSLRNDTCPQHETFNDAHTREMIGARGSARIAALADAQVTAFMAQAWQINELSQPRAQYPFRESGKESKILPRGMRAGRCTVSGPSWSADPPRRASHRAVHAVSR